MQMINYRAMWLAVVLVFAGMTGCVENAQVYESTELFPTSVDLVDVRSKEVVWTMDIPVRHKLKMEFWHETGIATKWQAPTKVVCRLYTTDFYSKTIYKKTIPLDIPVLVTVRHRSVPEYALPPMFVQPPTIDEPVYEPSAIEAAPPATVIETEMQATQPHEAVAEPEADAKEEEATQVVEPAVEEIESVKNSEAVKPAEEAATEAAVEEAVEHGAAPKQDEKWELPSLDSEKSKDGNGDYPALDE